MRRKREQTVLHSMNSCKHSKNKTERERESARERDILKEKEVPLFFDSVFGMESWFGES